MTKEAESSGEIRACVCMCVIVLARLGQKRRNRTCKQRKKKVRSNSKMFINAARPQVVSGDGQHYQLQPKQKQQKQGNLGTVASDSRLRQRAIAKKLLRNCNRNRFNQLTPDDIRAWSAAVLSQSQLTQHFHRRRYPQDADQVQNHQQQQALLQHPVAVPVPVPRPRPWPITKMEWRAIDSRSSDQSDDSFLV